MKTSNPKRWTVFDSEDLYLDWIHSECTTVEDENRRWRRPVVVKLDGHYIGMPDGFKSFIDYKYKYFPMWQEDKQKKLEEILKLRKEVDRLKHNREGK